MTRPPALTQAEKTAIVLSVLARECTLARAAAQNGVSAQAVANWRRAFIEAGSEGLSARSARRRNSMAAVQCQQLAREIDELKIALAEAHLASRSRSYVRAS